MSNLLPPLSASDLAQQLKSGSALRVVDVREPAEWISALGHIQGAELVPLGTLQQRLGDFAGEAREIVLICKMGGRATQAANLLAAQGHKARVMTGGMTAWNGAGLPISRDK